jgi:serine/threonine protein kinase
MMSLFGRVGSKTAGKDDLCLSDIEGLPRFEYRNLLEKEEIARGGFAAVFTAVIPGKKEKVVVKRHLDSDEGSKKTLVKEARLLHGLNHPNVVGFKGVCTDQLAILLEYVYFDFVPIGTNELIHSLAEFLSISN